MTRSAAMFVSAMISMIETAAMAGVFISPDTVSAQQPTPWPRPGRLPYYAVFDLWAPVWKQLNGDASLKVRRGNYKQIWTRSIMAARACEAANAKGGE